MKRGQAEKLMTTINRNAQMCRGNRGVRQGGVTGIVGWVSREYRQATFRVRAHCRVRAMAGCRVRAMADGTMWKDKG